MILKLRWWDLTSGMDVALRLSTGIQGTWGMAQENLKAYL